MSQSTTSRSTPTTAARPGLVLAAVCLCQLMVVLDVSVVNVALPAMDRSLHFSAGTLQWVVNAYTLPFGGLLLLGGRLADVIGPRRAVLAGLSVFALASILGGLAQNPGELIAARAVQGAAGAVLAPVSLTVIMVAFAEGPARNRAVGLWAMVGAAGAAVGVLLGGVLTDLLDWRWVLFINVPVAVAAGLATLASVRDTGASTRPRLDVVGAGLATAALTLLVYAMVEAGDHGWGSQPTLVALPLAVLGGAAFGWWECRRAAQPLVRPGILTVRTVWVAVVVVVFLGAATIAGFFFASLFLQNVLHYRPLKAGAAFLPFCAGITVGAMLSSALANRLGRRVVIGGGLVIGGGGMLLFSRLDVHSTFVGGFLLPSVLASVGIGLAMVANTSMATSGVAGPEAGMVSGLVNAARQCGGSVTLAVLSTVAVSTTGRAGDAAGLVAGYDRAFLVGGLLIIGAGLISAIWIPRVRAASADATEQAAVGAR